VVDGAISVKTPSNVQYIIWKDQVLPKDYYFYQPGTKVSVLKDGQKNSYIVSINQENLESGFLRVYKSHPNKSFTIKKSDILKDESDRHYTASQLPSIVNKGVSIIETDKNIISPINKEYGLSAPSFPKEEIKDVNTLLPAVIKKETETKNPLEEFKKIVNDKYGSNYDEYLSQATTEITSSEQELIKNILNSKQNETIKKTVFNPLTIIKHFKKAQDIFSISGDEYTKLKEEDAKNIGPFKMKTVKEYEKITSDLYRNKKLYDTWISGISDLLSEYSASGDEIKKESYKYKFLNESIETTNKFLPKNIVSFISNLVAAEDYNKSAGQLIKSYFGVDDKIDGKENTEELKPLPKSKEVKDEKTYTKDDVLKFNPVDKISFGDKLVKNNAIVLKLDDNKLMVCYVIASNEKQIEFKYNINGDYGFIDKYLVKQDGKKIDVGNSLVKNGEVELFYGKIVNSNGILKLGRTNLTKSKSPISVSEYYKDGIEDIIISIQNIYRLTGIDDKKDFDFKGIDKDFFVSGKNDKKDIYISPR
jgi:hypothetical protein